MHMIWHCIYGGFLKWWYSQIIHFGTLFLLKSMVLGILIFSICHPFFCSNVPQHAPARHWGLGICARAHGGESAVGIGQVHVGMVRAVEIPGILGWYMIFYWQINDFFTWIVDVFFYVLNLKQRRKSLCMTWRSWKQRANTFFVATWHAHHR